MSDLASAVSAGVLDAEERFGALLRSIVEVARAIFRAKASSILLLDEDTDELVFGAVAGEGEQTLVGRRLPSGTGIAGFVLMSGEPLVVEDVGADPRFSREAAESTGYIPKGVMAVPLLSGERTLGVLEVLDRPNEARFTLAEMQLLALFGDQAGIAVDLLLRARRARSALEGSGAAAAALARLAARLDDLDGARRESALLLVESLERLL